MAKTYYTTSSKLNTIDISPGNVIYCKDTSAIYIDNNNNERTSFALVVDCNTEEDRQRISYPNPSALFFVKETFLLYKFVDGGWVPLNTSSVKQVIFDDYEDFPPVGVENRIYVAGLDMYRYKNGGYQPLNGSNEWKPIA